MKQKSKIQWIPPDFVFGSFSKINKRRNCSGVHSHERLYKIDHTVKHIINELTPPWLISLQAEADRLNTSDLHYSHLLPNRMKKYSSHYLERKKVKENLTEVVKVIHHNGTGKKERFIHTFKHIIV
ncbi:hypothetical protein SteCoe_25881 [Stentor coeruleus]|uniref:Uncharacterized protein n=1 Tax=Stentor coeruleus TaxID=5963 RepID=A0A1R2BED7_9CILI|nr:hypothetical protein SteCoe_25881 [Stentor coeruleus]